jgi:hypothetical protein
MKRRIKFLLFVIFILLFINGIFLRKPFLGLPLTIFYFWLASLIFELFYKEKTLNLFLIFYLIAIGLGLPIIFYRISLFYFYIFFFILTLFIIFSDIFLRKKIFFQNKFFLNNDNLRGKRLLGILYFLFSIFYLLCLYFLFRARTGEFIISPWQKINPIYQIFYFLLLILLFLIIFLEKSIKKILIFLILFSFLSHAYIPIVYKIGLGVDTFLHLGKERRLMAFQMIQPTLFDLKNFGPFKVPACLIPSSKSSYASTWGLTIALSWLTSLDIFLIDKYLIFFLWSIFLSIFVYKIGLVIFNQQKKAAFLIYSLFLVYPFQVDGAITLPKSFNFLIFIFFLYLVLEYLKKPQKPLNYLIFFLFFSFYFNYLVYFVLSFETFIILMFIKKFPFWSKKRCFSFIFFFIFFLINFCLLDRISGFSIFHSKPLKIFENLLPSLIKFLNLWKSGEFIYFLIGDEVFSKYLPFGLKWNIFFMPIFLILLIFGLYLNRNKFFNDKVYFFLFLFLIFLFSNLYISKSFMWGLRIFVKRISTFFVFLNLIFFVEALFYLIEKIGKRNILKFLFLGLILSFFGLTTYTSGPKLEAITENEYKVAKFIQQDYKNYFKEKNFCILAHGRQNLIIEALTGEIQNGGFSCPPPTCEQEERIRLLASMISNPRKKHLEEAMKITKSKACYFIVNKEELKKESYEKAIKFLGEPKIIDSIYIWVYLPKT